MNWTPFQRREEFSAQGINPVLCCFQSGKPKIQALKRLKVKRCRYTEQLPIKTKLGYLFNFMPKNS